jgi:hypothetical protein
MSMVIFFHLSWLKIEALKQLQTRAHISPINSHPDESRDPETQARSPVTGFRLSSG